MGNAPEELPGASDASVSWSCSTRGAGSDGPSSELGMKATRPTPLSGETWFASEQEYLDLQERKWNVWKER